MESQSYFVSNDTDSDHRCQASSDGDRGGGIIKGAMRIRVRTQAKAQTRIQQFLFAIQLDTDNLRDTQDFL